jgi:hypothetical protein
MRIAWFALPLLGLLVGCNDPDPGAKDGAVSAGDLDADGDGYAADVDCDDASSAISPGAPEVCDGIDNDCDGAMDEQAEDGALAWVDADGDGFGDPDQPTTTCGGEPGLADNDGDCDDGDAAVSPDAREVCDAAGVDEDCDGAVNDADDSLDLATQTEFWPDSDGDGYGRVDGAPVFACDDGSMDGVPVANNDEDCDDGDAATSPDGVEVCDGVDNDCDDTIDEDDAAGAPIWYADADGDGYGDPGSPRAACAAPDGFVADDQDCDDGDAARNPETSWYADTDADGYGDPLSVTEACIAPSGTVADATDCDDAAVAVNPGATEVCDASDTDEDCSGAADDADTGVDAAGQSTWYADADADGYGALGDPGLLACDDPSSSGAAYSATADDCDDAASGVNPGAAEVCDAANTDEDCSGAADDADTGVGTASLIDWTVDADGDGYGDAAATAVSQCDDPSTAGTTYVADATDCDDRAAAISPGATEVCDDDDTDEDCDGDIDDDDASVDLSSATT